MVKGLIIWGILNYCFLTIAFGQVITFNRTYSTFENNTSWSILEEDNGYLLSGTGLLEGNGPRYAIKLIRADSLGDQLWRDTLMSRTLGYYHGDGRSMIHSYDSNYVCFGGFYDYDTSYSKSIIVKFDRSTGDSIWIREFGPLGDNTFFHGLELTNKDLIAIGYSRLPNTSNAQAHLVKVDSAGNLLWEKQYGGSRDDRGEKVFQTLDGGYLISGVNYDAQGYRNGLLIKTDSLGNQQWMKTYGGLGENWYAKAIMAPDSGYYLYMAWQDVAESDSMDHRILKLDPAGNIQWSKTIGKGIFTQIAQMDYLSDGNLLLVGQKQLEGTTTSHGWIAKIDTSANIIWERTYYNSGNPDPEDFRCWLNDFKETLDGGLVATGTGNVTGTFWANTQEFWLLKLDSNGCLYPEEDCTTTGIHDDIGALKEVNIYPNPTSTYLNISTYPANGQTTIPGGFISLYNLFGEEVLAQPLEQAQTRLDVSMLPAGVYVYSVTQNGQIVYGKVVVE